MVILKVNVTYNELLNFATDIIIKHSVEKKDDLVQISKFRKLVNTREANSSDTSDESSDDPWFVIIEGWVMGLGSKYDINIENYIRKEKLDKINKI